MIAAVDHQHFAGDRAAGGAEQERRRITDLVAERKALMQVAKGAADEMARIDALLIKHLGTAGKVETEAGSVTLSENNTYSDSIIESMLSVGQMQRVTKRVIDKAKVKANYPAVYAAAKVTSDTKPFKVTVS